MRDHKVKDEIQEYLKLSERPAERPCKCTFSVICKIIWLHLYFYHILTVLSTPRLADCRVTEEWVEHLAFGLKFPYSALRDLDLSNNDLKDSGVELLCDGLSSQCCRLKTLSLSGCQVTEEGCDYLATALKSNPSHLTELDLSYNNLGESGEKLLSELKNDPQNKLTVLKNTCRKYLHIWSKVTFTALPFCCSQHSSLIHTLHSPHLMLFVNSYIVCFINKTFIGTYIFLISPLLETMLWSSL
uniref:SPRY-associated domain-containing protein n=1 Tax=Sander lucioperca TaxID=283035 RepID=A0A8D0DBC4_SANLU